MYIFFQLIFKKDYWTTGKLKFDIEKVADLAMLKLTPEQKEKFGKQLDEILEYMEKLKELNTDNVEPLPWHCLPFLSAAVLVRIYGWFT